MNPRPKTTSMALLKEMTCIVQPRLEQAIGSNAARMIQQIHYWANKPYTDPILGKIEVRTFFGRRWVNVPPAFFNNPFRGAFRNWSQSTIDRSIAEAKRDGVLRTNSLGGQYNTNWYCVYEEHVGLLSTIYDEFDSQFEREWYAVTSSEKAKVQTLPKARQNAIWKGCERHLTAAKKQCKTRCDADAEFEAREAHSAAAAWEEIVSDVIDEEIEDFFEFYQIDGTIHSRGIEEESEMELVTQLADKAQSISQTGSVKLTDKAQSISQNSSVKMTELAPYIRVHEEQQQNVSEQQQEQNPAENFSPQRGDVVVVDSSFSEERLELDETARLAAELEHHGVGKKVAHDFAAQKADEARQQLEFLPFQKVVRGTGAFLTKAIREGYGPPEAFVAHQNSLSAAKNARQAQEKRNAQEDQERERIEREAAQDAAKVAHLDQIWETLSESLQATLEAQAIEKLGVLGPTGRAKAAMLAMRRTLLSELLAKAQGHAMAENGAQARENGAIPLSLPVPRTGTGG